MRKVIAIIVLAIAIWTGVEVYTRGVDGAFGGLFVNGLGETTAMLDAPAGRSESGRTMDAFQRAYDKSEQRVDDLLEQPGGSD
ncbi:MAG: hypothetical protein GY944_29755 [bacterium]|nr:hypothetical protein [bacterium]